MEKMATATRLDATATFIGIFRTWVNAGIITTPPPTPEQTGECARPGADRRASDPIGCRCGGGGLAARAWSSSGRRDDLDLGLGPVGLHRTAAIRPPDRACTRVETPV